MRSVYWQLVACDCSCLFVSLVSLFSLAFCRHSFQDGSDSSLEGRIGLRMCLGQFCHRGSLLRQAVTGLQVSSPAQLCGSTWQPPESRLVLSLVLQIQPDCIAAIVGCRIPLSSTQSRLLCHSVPFSSPARPEAVCFRCNDCRGRGIRCHFPCHGTRRLCSLHSLTRPIYLSTNLDTGIDRPDYTTSPSHYVTFLLLPTRLVKPL